MAIPVIAIVGRPNVGKSTLFNRLLGGRRAIVDDMPGVTRDRLYGEGEWRGRKFVLVDTGGFEPDGVGMPAAVRTQAEQAVAEADAICLLVDGKAGLTPVDEEIARYLRGAAARPIFLVVNKVDSPAQEPLTADFHRLGFAQVMPLSAEGGHGTGDLLDALLELFPGEPAEAPERRTVTVAIVGRPNVGKSSLVNRILGMERVLVSPEPGTTRDAVDTPFVYQGQHYVLVDTAGIRAQGRLGRSVERYSVSRALAALRRADVAILLLDGAEGVTAQDTRVGGEAHEAGCGVVIAVNKWDLRAGDASAAEEVGRAIREKFKYLEYASVAFVSALTGARVPSLFRLVDTAAAERERRVPTPELNEVVAAAVARRPPPAERGRPVKIRYVTQTGVRPPTFVCFTSARHGLHFSYLRYLENAIRRAYPFTGTPIRLAVRGRE
ncbi:MAG: ribosome biogenesis GTPase Der [Candidatus Methylomirabilales bacterium]